MQKSLNILLLCLLLLVGCNKQLSNTSAPKADQGTLQLAMEAPGITPEHTYSKADWRTKVELEKPDIDLFLVTIYRLTPGEPNNTRTKVIEKTYAELHDAINLTEGEYQISAQIGTNKLFTTDAPYYYAEQDFSITRGALTSISLKAAIKPFAVEIIYSTDFVKNFTNYYVEAEIDHVTDNYVFANNGVNNRAYIMPSTTRLILRGTLLDGKIYSSLLKEVHSTGKELHTFRLNILPKGHSFDIGVETSVETLTGEGKIPENLYPALPEIAAKDMNFYETTASAIDQAWVDLPTSLAFKSIEFTFAGDAFASLGLLPGTYSTASPDQVAALQNAGIEFENGVIDRMADAAIEVSVAKVSFAKLAQKLTSQNGVNTPYSIICRRTDRLGTTSQDELSITIHPPVFTMPDVLVGNVWSKNATFAPLAAENIVHGDFAVMTAKGFKYQYSADNTTWINVENGSLTCKNLGSGKQYALRAVYRDNIFSAPTHFTTEATAQVPNGNMEDWQKEIFNKKMARYYPWSSGGSQWWDTNNTRTCSYDATIYTSAYNSFPATSYIYGGRSGKAAELRTISASGSGLNSKSNEVDAHRTPGRLFVGSYKYNGGNAETITRGRGFNSRPTAMTFYYQYEPWGGNAAQGGDDEFRGYIELFSGGVSIGKGEFTHRTSNRACITTWTQAYATINYTDPTKKADQIVIDFVSTTAASPIVSDDWRRRGSEYVSGKYNNNYANGCPTLADFDYGGKMWQYYGSVLKLDDIELVYDK